MGFFKAPVALAIFSVFAEAHAAPTVSFKAPVNGQTISGSLKQSSACEVGGSSIKRVKFYLDSTQLSSDNNAPRQCNLDQTAAPYQCAIDTYKFADGSYTLMAVATDNVGATL